MRRLALLLLFALPLFGYEVRSQKYALAISVERAGDTVAYVIQVTDIVTGAVLAADRVEAVPNMRFEKKLEAGNRKLRVAIRELDGKLSADLDVEQNGLMIDLLRSTWLASPRPVSRWGEGPFRVGGDVRPPVLVHRVEPLYTEEAKAARISGIVILELVINREGNVSDAKMLKPLPFGLDEMALVAVRQWKFKPGTINGDPVDVIYNITMNFMLDE